jgi:hypothetical protein
MSASQGDSRGLTAHRTRRLRENRLANPGGEPASGDNTRLWIAKDRRSSPGRSRNGRGKSIVPKKSLPRGGGDHKAFCTTKSPTIQRDWHLSRSSSDRCVRLASCAGPRVCHSCAIQVANGGQRWLPSPPCGFPHSIPAASPLVAPPSCWRARHESTQLTYGIGSPHGSHYRSHH